MTSLWDQQTILVVNVVILEIAEIREEQLWIYNDSIAKNALSACLVHEASGNQIELRAIGQETYDDLLIIRVKSFFDLHGSVLFPPLKRHE